MVTAPPPHDPVRILFVFAWLVVGGEETEVRLLARHLDRAKYRIEVLACFRKEGMPDQTHQQLEALGIDVDRTAYGLSFADTIGYLSRKIPAYDIVVSCQDVADIYPALERLFWRPPLIEHGGLVSEALSGPKHLTTRYVGVCRSIRDAAASKMPDRPECAVEIPSMVDLSECRPEDRAAQRERLGIGDDVPLIGWVGRLDAKKRVEDFIEAAALAHRRAPQARFVVVGGPDAFMPDYAERLRGLAAERGLAEVLFFLGDRDDIPSLLSAMDIFVWLSRGEGMPHVIAEAGAAGLPVIATADNGSVQQIEDEVSGLFVPHERPAIVADAMIRLIGDKPLRARLGAALRRKVESTFAAGVVVPQWLDLFEGVLSERAPAPPERLFQSFFLGGFECSTHRRRDGHRIDVIAATEHDKHAESDYRQLAGHGLRAMRDGVRWHLIEATPSHYDWSSFLPMLRASRRTGTQVIWDLLHYGWPDDLDIWRPDLVKRFARFAAATARVVRDETDAVPFYCPVNEVSFFSWGGGDATYLNPFASGRGFELKVQLARAAIAAMEEILVVEPRARFVHCEPAINIICDPARPDQRGFVDGLANAQYQAWDLIGGYLWPQLGGLPRYLDVLGINYYHNNQWIHGSPPIDWDHPLYKPFSRVLTENYARYGKPLLVAETGIEGDRRREWLAYIAAQTEQARSVGVPVEGICLYPVLDHPGWDDDRPCPNGLLSDRNPGGPRPVFAPLAAELAAQRERHARRSGAGLASQRPGTVSDLEVV